MARKRRGIKYKVYSINREAGGQRGEAKLRAGLHLLDAVDERLVPYGVQLSLGQRNERLRPRGLLFACPTIKYKV